MCSRCAIFHGFMSNNHVRVSMDNRFPYVTISVQASLIVPFIIFHLTLKLMVSTFLAHVSIQHCTFCVSLITFSQRQFVLRTENQCLAKKVLCFTDKASSLSCTLRCVERLLAPRSSAACEIAVSLLRAFVLTATNEAVTFENKRMDRISK